MATGTSARQPETHPAELPPPAARARVLTRRATLSHAPRHALSLCRRCKKLQRQLFDTSTCGFSSCSFGGAYQPQLPQTFYGFSYLYDRTAAIGLLDGKQQQFGSQQMSVADIERAGAELCALEQPAVAARFQTHQDASKSSNFCGDVAYLTTLLTSFGFAETHSLSTAPHYGSKRRAADRLSLRDPSRG